MNNDNGNCHSGCNGQSESNQEELTNNWSKNSYMKLKMQQQPKYLDTNALNSVLNKVFLKF
jgi:hypothetical protein